MLMPKFVNGKFYFALIVYLSVATSSVAFKEIQIPRSMGGDKGKYFLIDAKKHGPLIETLHKRIGVDSTGYTRVQINCKNNMIRELGYSEVSPESIKIEPTEWFDLVEGSSKSDLANFVCKRFTKSH